MIAVFEKVDIENSVALAIDQTAEEFVKTQQQQLSTGIRADGKVIINVKTGSDEYSPSYAKYKGFKKPINLKDKGDFYRGIFVDVRTNTVVIDSADEKTQSLLDRYGEKIFGLDAENAAIYSNEYMAPAAIKLVNNGLRKLHTKNTGDK